MTREDRGPDRWVIARRAYECAGLVPSDLAALMGVSLKVLVKRLKREAWADPKQINDTGAVTTSARSKQTEAQQVLAQFRSELAAQVAAFADGPIDRDTFDAAAEKNARTLQMMLRNFEKLTELTGQAEADTAEGGGADDTQYMALRAELARRLRALRANGKPRGA